MDERELERLLGEVDEPSPGECATPPAIDLSELAEYLDGVLEADRKPTLEAHLANCPACRELAFESGLSRIQAEAWSGDGEPVLDVSRGKDQHPGTRRVWQRWGALAALALLGLSLGLWRSRDRDAQIAAGLRSVGLGEAEVATLPRPLGDQVREAVAGRLPAVEIFPGVDLSGGEVALRGPSLSQAAQLVAPRWTLSRQARPLFQWYPSSLLQEAEGYAGELLLVDGTERLVALVPFSGQGEGLFSLTLPQDIPALSLGEIYYWKVNEWELAGELAGEVLASEYVPFRLQEPSPGHGSVGGFVAVVEAASAGFYEEALEGLAALRLKGEGENIRERLLARILRAKRCPRDLQTVESERWRATFPAVDSTAAEP